MSSVAMSPLRAVPYGSHLHQQHRQEYMPQRHPQPHQSQPHMSPPFYATPNSHHHQQSYSYGYQQKSATPQSPPSPPSEDTMKPSLPSIQSLLGMAKHEQPTGPTSQSHNSSPQQQPASEGYERAGFVAAGNDIRPHIASHSWATSKALASSVTLPPTPPLGPEPTVEVQHSPSTISTHSTLPTTPYYPPQSSGSLHGHHHRTSASAEVGARQTPLGSNSPVSPYAPSSYAPSSYPPRSHVPTGPYESPDPHSVPPTGLYAQRPLPSNFPPPMHVPLPQPQPAANPWQHHHYISANSQAAFPQTQDRYICPTCNKAFSRPSSLRIHSHSHTGEKPFKCSHSGCGKAFSVRSNMKRHERGCHAVAGNGGSN